jgi:hypothetical protein
MIKGSHDNAKRSFTDFLRNFITIVNVIIVTDMVLVLVGVKAVVCCFINAAPLNAASKARLLAFLLLPLLDIEVVNILVF